jgi:hypothetical protein
LSLVETTRPFDMLRDRISAPIAIGANPCLPAGRDDLLHPAIAGNTLAS